MKANPLLWMLATCIAATLAGSALPARAGAPDAWISTKVKMQLLVAPHLNGFPVDVDTDEGRVTLHGKVSTSAEQAEAERIARAASGVISVRNLLQVVPASRRRVVQIADDRLSGDVTAALASDPAFSTSSIRVKSVNKGVVLLSGKAATLSAHLLALEVTSAVPGVRQVASEIESPDEFGDREVWYDEAPAAPGAGNTVTDGWITAQTKVKFMTDADSPRGDINVDTRHGVVTLFGTVSNPAASENAVRLAREVSGVASVKSELRVVRPAQNRQATENDGDIATMVRRRIADAGMTGADVTVDVKAATAHLTGTVQHASHRYAAVSIAHGTPGVERVQDDLRIDAPKPGKD